MEAIFAASVFMPAQIEAQAQIKIEQGSKFIGQQAEAKAAPAKPVLVRQGSSFGGAADESNLAFIHMDSLLLYRWARLSAQKLYNNIGVAHMLH